MRRKYLFDEKLLNTFKDVEETPKKEEKVEEVKDDSIETYYEELDKIIDNIKKELGHEDKIDEAISQLKEKLAHLSDKEDQEKPEEDKKEVLDEETFSEDEVESLKKLANSGIVDKLLALIKTFDEVDEESNESEEVKDDEEDKKDEDEEEVLETKTKDSFNSIYFNEVEEDNDQVDEIAKAWSSRIKK